MEQDRFIANRQRLLGRSSIDGPSDFAVYLAPNSPDCLVGILQPPWHAHLPPSARRGQLVPLVPLALKRRSGPDVAAPLEELAEEAAVLRGAKAEGPAVGGAATAEVGPAVGEAAIAVVGLAVGEAALGEDPAAMVPEVEGAAQGPASLNWAGQRTATWSVPYLTTKPTH